MPRVPRTLLLAAAVALAAVPAIQAQPRFPPTTPTPLAVTLLSAIDDDNIVAELKLSDEQVKKLVGLRQETWDAAYTSSRSKLAETAAERAKASDEFLKKTLSADQYKRAVQLGAQSVLRSRFGPEDAQFDVTSVRALTLGYPELVTALKLTAEQQKELTAETDPSRPFGRASIALKPEQTAAAKDFLGTPFTKTWAPRRDPRLQGFPEQPGDLSILAAKDVRAEVKLSDDQKKELDPLRDKWAALDNERFNDLSPKEAHARAAELTAESEKALAKVLKPEQAARLKQIALQEQSGSRDIEHLYTRAEIVKALGLTDKQVKDFDAAWEAHRTAARKVFEAGEAFEATEKAVMKLTAARRARTEAVLVGDQAEKLKAMFGESFRGNTQPDDDGPDGAGNFLETIRAATFGKYTKEFSQLAGNKSIQDELKMTDDQVKKAVAARDDMQAKFRRGDGLGDLKGMAKMYDERSKAVETEMGKLLSADQVKRFRQIMLQSCERPPEGRGFTSAVPSAASYPGVAEAIKLSDDQKKKLVGGTAPAEVLTGDQKDAIAKMLGDPFKGNFTTPRTGFLSFPAAPATVGIYQRAGGAEAFAKLLKLSDDQAQKLAAARQEYASATRTIVSRGFGPVSADVKAMKAAVEVYDKVADGILSEEQKKRATQLQLQVAAAESLLNAVTAPDTAKALELTDDQAKKLVALSEDAGKLHELFFLEGLDDNESKGAMKLRDAADERLLAVLSDTQKKKWKEMTGEPWEGLRKSLPNRFGGFGEGGFGRGSFGGDIP